MQPVLVPRESSPAGGAGLTSWATLLHRHRRLFQRCQKNPSEKNVHALRVATRRLAARLELLQPAMPARLRQRMGRRLKRLLRATAATRDSQVQCRLFQRLTPRSHHPGWQQIRHHLKKRRRKSARRLPAEMQPLPAWPARLRPGRPTALSPDAGRVLQRACRRMQTRLRRARPDDTAAQHRARVALKQYRYLVETLAAARGEPPAPLLRQLQRAQSALGALHDFELLRRRLEKFAARHGPAADWLRARLATLARHHQALIRARPAFLAGMTAFRPLAFPRKQKPRAGAVAP